jgi:cation diffusion facilitator CzcD-associated flavoprotein CzcO
VGAGISGIETALAFQEYGIPHVVFEQSSAPGVVWEMSNAAAGSTNEESHAQVDPVSFAPSGWYLDTNSSFDTSEKLRGIYPSINAVQATTKKENQEWKHQN